MILLKRDKGRNYNQMRPLHISYDEYGYAASSVLITFGNTKVLCSVTLQQGGTFILKRKKTGWLTAEYAMLPIATALRVQRESSAAQRQGRSVEISRLIGRVIRCVVNLDHIGEQTIVGRLRCTASRWRDASCSITGFR